MSTQNLLSTALGKVYKDSVSMAWNAVIDYLTRLSNFNVNRDMVDRLNNWVDDSSRDDIILWPSVESDGRRFTPSRLITYKGVELNLNLTVLQSWQYLRVQFPVLTKNTLVEDRDYITRIGETYPSYRSPLDPTATIIPRNNENNGKKLTKSEVIEEFTAKSGSTTRIGFGWYLTSQTVEWFNETIEKRYQRYITLLKPVTGIEDKIYKRYLKNRYPRVVEYYAAQKKK